MQKLSLRDILDKFTQKTAELNSDLEKFESVDISKMSDHDRKILIDQMERIETLTAKAENILKKTSREGLPILVQKQENKNDLKNDNQAAPAPKKKSRLGNLMKPTLGLNNTPNNNEKKKDKE